MDIWPRILDRKGALDAIHVSAGVCYFVGIVTGLAAIIAMISDRSILGVDGWGLVDASFFALFGWRIWKASQIAAVCALALYCFELCYKLTNGGHIGNPIVVLLLLWGLVQGIRGTFALKRFQGPQIDLPEALASDGLGSRGTDAFAPTTNHLPVDSASSKIQAILHNWKRWCVTGLAIGVGFATALALIAWMVNAYTNRASDVKHWPSMELSGTVAKIELKTQWKNGLKYVLEATPSSPSAADEFDTATQDLDKVGFSIVFYDGSGFQLCTVEAERLIPAINSEGKRTELESNGESALCSASEYRQAATWSANYRFPKKKADFAPLTEAPLPTYDPPRSKPVLWKGGSPLDSDDVITGNDFLGEIDTKEYRFHIVRSGERMSSIDWDPGTQIHVSCDRAGTCVLVDSTNGHTLRATRIR